MSEQFFGKGISLAAGFDLGAKLPLDSRLVVNTIDELDAHVAGNRAYVGMLVYVIADGKNYQFDGNQFNELAPEIDLSSYATIAYVDEQVANAVTNGTIDLSGYAKVEDMNRLLADKVDKQEGKALMLISEIARLANVDNYDDTEVKELIGAKAAQTDLDAVSEAVAKKADAEEVNAALELKAVKADVEQALEGKADKADLEGLVDGDYVDGKIAELVGTAPDALNTLQELAQAIEDHQDVYDIYVEEVDAKLSKKIDAAEGYGLMSDEEREKLAGLENFDASELEAAIEKKVDKVEGFSLVSNIEIERLANVNNYDDTEIREILDSKLDAIPEEYVTAEELEAEGFLKEHQNISHLAVKAEVEAALEEKAPVEHVHDYNDLENLPEIPSVEGLASEVFVGMSHIYSNDMNTVNALGGIPAGTNLNGMTLAEILTKLLFPYVAPVVSVTGTPNGGVFEKGNTQIITNVKVAITKKSEVINKIEIYDGSTLLASQEDEAIAAGGTFNYNVNVPVESVNKQLTVKVTDASGEVVSKTTAAFSFVYPYYYGVCAEDAEINEELVLGLYKKIEKEGVKSISYTTDNQRMVIAFPKSYGVLTSAIDPNGFENISSFKASELSIVGLDGSSQSYYVYVNEASTVSDFIMKFTM